MAAGMMAAPWGHWCPPLQLPMRDWQYHPFVVDVIVVIALSLLSLSPFGIIIATIVAIVAIIALALVAPVAVALAPLVIANLALPSLSMSLSLP
jgi:hypothetical protein